MNRTGPGPGDGPPLPPLLPSVQWPPPLCSAVPAPNCPPHSPTALPEAAFFHPSPSLYLNGSRCRPLPLNATWGPLRCPTRRGGGEQATHSASVPSPLCLVPLLQQADGEKGMHR
mmetsp:Transcript_93814/g.162433  ORF Transcript_93814/g.162433 Transcript_93814/m.162433 type:complete len:115 (-) Transcript_93814:224-568(-)